MTKNKPENIDGSPTPPAPTNAAALLEEMAELLKLRGENVFKVRAFEKAVDIARATPDLKRRAEKGTLTEIDGIGKGIAAVLTEFFNAGHSKELDALRQSIPAGLVEFSQLPGVGPKKAQVLIDELGISTLSELEYACKEHRLLELKGFGEKAQEKILKALELKKKQAGYLRIDDAMIAHDEIVAQFDQAFAKKLGGTHLQLTGALRRRREIVSSLPFLLPLTQEQKKNSELTKKLKTWFAEHEFSIVDIDSLDEGVGSRPCFARQVAWVDVTEFPQILAQTTGSAAHISMLAKLAKSTAAKNADHRADEGVYAGHGLPWIAPEFREDGTELDLAQHRQLNTLIGEISGQPAIRGVFHNHTNRSDGTATLEEMVIAAKKLKLEYLGISDHSQSAFYARGLKTDAIREQEAELKEVQDRHPEIKIFWGIESDILQDGSLDYPQNVLKKFDFVVASIHSRFGMDRKQMTERILKAVQNPATRFIGHPTGRLLLGREPFDFDHDLIFAEAAKHDVALEINANPARLDLDWREGPLLRKYGTPVAINPDAHEIQGLADIKYGLWIARKALLPQSQVINSRSTKDVASWLARR